VQGAAALGRHPLVDQAALVETLQRLGPLAQELVLVGGQAVDVWTTRYKDRVAALEAEWPFTTKDIDFCGTSEQARACAKLLGGSLKEFDLQDRTLCLAILKIGDVQVDFLRAPYGLPDVEQLKSRSVPYEFGRVMHPLHMLTSRVANMADLPSHQSERHRKQLRGAILAVRAFIAESCEQATDQRTAVRSALQMSEQIITLASTEPGLRANVEHGFDVLDALVLGAPMPQAFAEKRVPQARAQVEAKRLQWQRRSRSPEQAATAPGDAELAESKSRKPSQPR